MSLNSSSCLLHYVPSQAHNPSWTIPAVWTPEDTLLVSCMSLANHHDGEAFLEVDVVQPRKCKNVRFGEEVISRVASRTSRCRWLPACSPFWTNGEVARWVACGLAGIFVEGEDSWKVSQVSSSKHEASCCLDGEYYSMK